MELQLQRKKYKSPEFWTSYFCELCSFTHKMLEEGNILGPPVYLFQGKKKKEEKKLK